MSLTILGGHGFVGKHYTDMYYHHAIGNIASINDRDDYEVHSADVLYLISTVHNYHVFDEPHRDIDTNLTVLINVLENWRKSPDSAEGVFNFTSSWSVYGNQPSPVAEDAPCDPKGFYIITKRCAEQLLISYCETFHLKYRILRFANIVGPGDTKVSSQKNVLQYSINQLAAGKDVQLFGDGMFFRDFMHVDDCVRAVETVMAKGNTNEIYNIGNGPTWYYIDILGYAKHELRSSGNIILTEPTEFQKRVPVASFYMNTDKLRGLGFHSDYFGAKLYDSLIPTEKTK
jgi:nucleoside-diphosphate-sugar epimerase